MSEENHTPNDVNAEQAGQGKLILLVDDEDFIRDAGSAMLELSGHAVITADGTEEAVRIYTQRWKEIDLVIIDLSMPGKDGGACFRDLRIINPDVRALLTSGYNADSNVRGLLAEGMLGLLQKPFSMGTIRETLDDIFSE
jgi:CheY-like chemotaxis protein